ncbi:MAG: ROK family protein [Actinomycetota bacterium]
MIARGGIDLGGTKIQTAVVDGRNKVRGEARVPTPTSGGPADVAAAMAGAMREAAEQAGTETGKLLGVGVGAPGDADPRGVVSGASNLPGWEGSYPLADELQKQLGTKVIVGGDVQVATEAEFRLGAGKPYSSILGVFWGTGVGGGLVLDGKPWIGRGNAGEIGHMVIERGGERCPCGRRGCIEAYAGRGAMEAKARHEHKQGTNTDLFKIMKERGHDRLKSSVWEHAVEDRDKLAIHLIDRAVKALAAGIASAVNLLDPEAVIIGGGLGTRFGQPYVKRIEERMHKHLFVDDRPPAMHVAALGDLGGAIGAALLVAEPRG